MRILMLMLALVLVGSFTATQSFAGTHGEPHITDKSKGAKDHHEMMMYYEEQAELAKSKARDWDFAADYYEKFPGEVVGKMTPAEHVAHCRSIAEEFNKDAKRFSEMADKHRSLMRKDVM